MYQNDFYSSRLPRTLFVQGLAPSVVLRVDLLLKAMHSR